MNTIEFIGGGTFEAMYAAQHYLDENGYSYGSTCANMPVAILKGDVNIAKWKNLTPKERKEVHGVIAGDMRTGPVKIIFYDGHAPSVDVVFLKDNLYVELTNTTPIPI